MSEQVTKIKPVDISDVKYNEKGDVVFNSGCLKESIICLRPSHKKQIPQIYAEVKHNKLISHNYGHGGVGYSVLFGTVEKAIENFNKVRFDHNIIFSEEITVVGLGCIGLVTALTLAFRGYTNIKIIAEKYTQTPSHLAGGLIEFSLSTIFAQEQIETMNYYFKHTFLEYIDIVKGKHKFIRYGVKEVDYYTDFYQEGAGLDHIANLGLIPKAKQVKVKVDGNHSSPVFDLHHFKTFQVNTTVFMDSLMYTINKLNIPVEFKKLNSFADIKSKVVFNCSGLGSRELNMDNDVYPTAGHGFLLNDPNIIKHDYILRLSKIPGMDDSPSQGAIYFMTKNTGFIGGSYVTRYDGKDEEKNRDYLNKLVERCRYVFNGIKKAEMKPKF